MCTCVSMRERVCVRSKWSTRGPLAAWERRKLLKCFFVLPQLPCFYWPRWMLQRGNQMWDRDDLKGQVINIICLNFLILMGWCLQRWPWGGGKHDLLNMKWEKCKGFWASRRALLLLWSANSLILCVYACERCLVTASILTASSFNFLFTKKKC